MYRLLAVLAALLAAPPDAFAQAIDYARSQVTIVSRQMNVPVEAPFKKYNAQIAFNAEKPETSKARVEIDLASFDIGDAEINENVSDRYWFDVKNHPTAVFVSSALRAVGTGRYEVRGPLTLKGRTHEVVAPFSVRTAGADRIFEGSFPIKRLQYNVGDAHWRDTSVVADEVLIKFRLYQAASKPAPSK